MEQIIINTSHILRRPVTSLLGLTSVMEDEEEMDESGIKEYAGYIQEVAQEMERFTKQLNEVYQNKKNIVSNEIDNNDHYIKEVLSLAKQYTSPKKGTIDITSLLTTKWYYYTIAGLPRTFPGMGVEGSTDRSAAFLGGERPLRGGGN